jgi:hypothetical protein
MATRSAPRPAWKQLVGQAREQLGSLRRGDMVVGRRNALVLRKLQRPAGRAILVLWRPPGGVLVALLGAHRDTERLVWSLTIASIAR